MAACKDWRRTRSISSVSGVRTYEHWRKLLLERCLDHLGLLELGTE